MSQVHGDADPESPFRHRTFHFWHGASDIPRAESLFVPTVGIEFVIERINLAVPELAVHLGRFVQFVPILEAQSLGSVISCTTFKFA